MAVRPLCSPKGAGRATPLNVGRATLNRVGIFQCPEHRFFFFYFFSQISLHLFLIGKSEIEQADIFPTNVAVP